MRIRVALFSAVAVLVTAGAASTASAPDKVWSGLVMAENVEKPHPVPAPLQSIEKTLVALFGYNQFEVIGESNKALKTGEEDWLATSKYFSLNVDANGVTESGYELNLKLYQDKQLLLETATKLSKQSPLVIKGPQIGGGQLLLVLIVDNSAFKGDPGQSQHSRRHPRESNSLVTGWHHVTRFFKKAVP
jgi:hypothetical protein